MYSLSLSVGRGAWTFGVRRHIVVSEVLGRVTRSSHHSITTLDISRMSQVGL